jgi:hypothetical protein
MQSGAAFWKGYYCVDGAGDAEFVASSSACAACGVPRATKRCSRCAREHYCSKDCQARAWPSHKRVCMAGSAREAPPAPRSPGVLPAAAATPIAYASVAASHAVIRPWAVSEEFIAHDASYKDCDAVRQRDAAVAAELAGLIDAVVASGSCAAGREAGVLPVVLMPYVKELLDCELYWPASASTKTPRVKGALCRALPAEVMRAVDEHARWAWNFRFFSPYVLLYACVCMESQRCVPVLTGQSRGASQAYCCPSSLMTVFVSADLPHTVGMTTPY